MSALVRAELRQASDVILGAIVILLASFPLAFLGVYMQGVRPYPWTSAIAGGCILNQYSMVLTAALLGASTFARNREEGSIQFLAYLPIEPQTLWLGKTFAGALVWCGLWSFNGILLLAVLLALEQGVEPLLPFLPRMFGICALSFAAWGTSAAAGCFLTSVTSAAFAGLAGTAVLIALRFGWQSIAVDGEFFTAPVLALFGAEGVGAFAISLLALRVQAGRGTGDHSIRFVRRSGRSISCIRGSASALLWKDIQLQRPMMLIGWVLFLIPFSAAVGAMLLTDGGAQGFRVASLIGMALAWVILPMWSAGSLANEWAASSERFLMQLPVTLKRVVLAKLFVAVAPTVCLGLACIAVFLVSQATIESEPSIRASMTWEEFASSHFLSGAVAYAGGMPASFAVAWFFAARLRRRLVAMVIGVLSGPVAMATWAIPSMPGGFIAERLPPVPAAGIHFLILGLLSAALIWSGTRTAIRNGSSESTG